MRTRRASASGCGLCLDDIVGILRESKRDVVGHYLPVGAAARPATSLAQPAMAYPDRV